MNWDIGELLSHWPCDSGSNVRRILGDDGREKVQIRVCIDSFHGILQFDSDGRPDGKRPHGREFYLDHLESRRKRRERNTPAGGFALNTGECRKLFEESLMTYQRYVVMLQLGDFDRVIRDTERNMRLFRFLNRYAAGEEDRNRLECWWPYILRIHYTARSMKHLNRNEHDQALAMLTECREQLDGLVPQDNDTFRNEIKRSMEEIERMTSEIRSQKPLSQMEQLEKAKAKAIKDQRYEDAARLRDCINEMKETETHPKA